MDAKLRFLASAHPLRPGITKQRVGQQAERMRLARARRYPPALRTEAGTIQGDGVRTGIEVGVDSARCAGARFEGNVVTAEFEEDIGQGEVAVIADVADEHWDYSV